MNVSENHREDEKRTGIPSIRIIGLGVRPKTKTQVNASNPNLPQHLLFDSDGSSTTLIAPSLDSPVEAADRFGQIYTAQKSQKHRKSHGLYLTPQLVARFMAGMISPKNKMRLLDPAAGAGVLICAAIEQLATCHTPPQLVEVVAYEIDPSLTTQLAKVLDHMKVWAADKGMNVKTTIHCSDFILSEGHSLRLNNNDLFDLVIANPPYFKISKDDPRAIAAFEVVHGQPNIYGLFMAVAAAMLRQGGEFIFITPRSFASGPYFKRFRDHFFSMIRPLRTHLFNSRRETFIRDEVLQENVILYAIRDDKWKFNPKGLAFTISSSEGISDIGQNKLWHTELLDVIDPNNLSKAFRLPSGSEDEDILRRVDNWRGSLQAYGLDISTGPVVAFRATEFLAINANEVTVPLLWLNNITKMDIEWPKRSRKPQFIKNNINSQRLLLPNSTYVLLRRFSAKEEERRLTAAPFIASQIKAPKIGLENHLNYIHRPGSCLTDDEAFGLAAFLNSKLMDIYFRCFNGNTQVSATELRAMPLPPLSEIVQLGSIVRKTPHNLEVIDRIVDSMAQPIKRIEKAYA